MSNKILKISNIIIRIKNDSKEKWTFGVARVKETLSPSIWISWRKFFQPLLRLC